jgi:hypothetical protein
MRFLQATPVACARARRKLADPLTSILKAATEMIDHNGPRSEAPYLSKLGYAKIIPTAEQKTLEGDDMGTTPAKKPR